MTLTELYKIDGKPMVAPDADVQMSFEDLDGAQSGRDESGFMHRILVRRKVGDAASEDRHDSIISVVGGPS